MRSKSIAQSIVTQLDQTGLNPPNKSDFITTPAQDQAMKFLIRSGQVVELDPKIVITSAALDAATQKVKELHLKPWTSYSQRTAPTPRLYA